MPVAEDYSPKYVESLEDLPVSGPDDYTPGQKRKALYRAETELELDVNEGSEITSITKAHRVAAANLATHVLTHAAEEPSSATLGDMSSGGGTITEYSSEYKETYNDIVEKLLETGTGKSENYAVFVNNGTVGTDSTTHTV